MTHRHLLVAALLIVLSAGSVSHSSAQEPAAPPAAERVFDSAGERVFDWQVAHARTSQQEQRETLGSAARRLVLRNGWSCDVSALLLRGDAEVRSARCRRDPQRVDFELVCRVGEGAQAIERKLPPEGPASDFLRLECKPRP